MLASYLKPSSRIKGYNESHIFENVIFYDYSIATLPCMLWSFPSNLDEKLKTIIPEFALPMPASGEVSPKYNGISPNDKHSSLTTDSPTPITYHAFALTTDDSGHLLFGFCHVSNSILLVILSYRPWYTPFYRLLNQLLGSITKLQTSNDEIYKFLAKIYEHCCEVTDENGDKDYTNISEGNFSFSYKHPDLLDNPLSDGIPPVIPTNLLFTELYNCLSQSNMLTLWTSLLYERRVLLVSKKLNRLSSTALSPALSLIPLQWQHIFIPILPHKLIETVTAPLPFLIGLPRHVFNLTEFSGTFDIRSANRVDDMGENTITIVDLDADCCVFYEPNSLQNSVENLTPATPTPVLPNFIVANLTKRLIPRYTTKVISNSTAVNNHENIVPGSIYLGEAFLLAMVELIGEYRNGLLFEPGSEINFQPELFLKSCRPSARTCLEQILKTQMFEQFISERLQLLNSGHGFDDVFEREVNIGEAENNKFSQMQRYKDWLGYMKSEGDFYLKSLKNKTANSSVTLLKNVPTLDWAYSNLKTKGKSAYNIVRQLRPFNNNSSQTAKKSYESPSEKATEFYYDLRASPALPDAISEAKVTTLNGHASSPALVSREFAESKSLPYNWKSDHLPYGIDTNNNETSACEAYQDYPPSNAKKNLELSQFLLQKELTSSTTNQFIPISQQVTKRAGYIVVLYFANARFATLDSRLATFTGGGRRLEFASKPRGKDMVLIRQNSNGLSKPGNNSPFTHPFDPINDKSEPDFHYQEHTNGSNVLGNGLPKLPSPQTKPRRRNGRQTESLIDLDSVPSGPDLDRLAADRLLAEFGAIDFNGLAGGNTTGLNTTFQNGFSEILVTDSAVKKNVASSNLPNGCTNANEHGAFNGVNGANDTFGSISNGQFCPNANNGIASKMTSTVSINYLPAPAAKSSSNYSMSQQQPLTQFQSWETFD